MHQTGPTPPSTRSNLITGHVFTTSGALALAVVMVVAGCSNPVDSARDSSVCPGESCADDTRERSEVISEIDGVVEVVSVSRTYGLDRGSARTAEVTSDAADKDGRIAVGLAVMRALDDWPEHSDGAAHVVVSPVAAGERVTLLLDGDYVCEEINRVRRPCGPDNSWPLHEEETPA